MTQVAKRRLPPISALRGFEAAARHLSFTLAADELCLTQSAISYQIRELEEYLGTSLFRRFTRRVELTKNGEEFARLISHFIEDLEQHVVRYRAEAGRRKLTITVLPTIASHWLMPRLHLFSQSHPGVETQIISGLSPPDLLAHEADVAIRVGRLPGRHYERRQPRIEMDVVASWSGVHADELFPDLLIPVCSPALLAGQYPVKLADLVHLPLIHTSTRRFAWHDWLHAHGLRAPAPRADLSFGHFFMSLEAARRGLGVAIVPHVVLASREDRNDLINPLGEESDRFLVPSAGEYYLLVHERRLHDPLVVAFRSWLLSVARPFRAEAHQCVVEAMRIESSDLRPLQTSRRS